MLRITVVTSDASAAANVGGPVNVSYRSFEIEAPGLEAFIAEDCGSSLVFRCVAGVEFCGPALTRSKQQ